MEESGEVKEGFVKRLWRKVNPFSGMPGPSDEFQEGTARSSVSQPDQNPSQPQGPQTLTPEPQR